MNYKKIYIVGSIALDDIETPHVSGSRLLGGSATYGSLFSSLFAPTSIIGVVGSDFPEDGHNLFKHYKINTENLTVSPGKTFSWGGKYHNDFNYRDTLFTDLGVFESYSPNISISDQDSSILFLANIHPSLQQHIIKQAPENCFIAADTMNLWIDNNKKELLKVLSHVNLLFINEEEALSLTRTKTIKDAAIKLFSLGPDKLVIKKGSFGSIYISKNSFTSIGVCNDVSVIDPTGAGDAFAGGFLGSIVKNGWNIMTALEHGTASAGLAISCLGAQELNNISYKDIARLKKTIIKT
tara:strand:+ start:855 stop:1742 length:888 start_codon:yes stop_codon:yes gene_type:complete